MIDRKELKKKLPRGYCKKIAKAIGVTPQSISLYFAYKINSYRIEVSILKVLSRIDKEEQELLDQIK